MATSARHVVGLHEPPKNTSGAGALSAEFSSDLDVVAVAVSVDADDASKRSGSCGCDADDGPCVRNRFKSAASTQNSPNVSPFIWRCALELRPSKLLHPRRANSFAVCNISLTMARAGDGERARERE